MWTFVAIVFHALLKLAWTLLLFLLYGYAERVYHAGAFVAIALSLYLMKNVGLLNPLVLLLFHLVAQIYQLKVVVFFSFLALELLFLFSSPRPVDDAIVSLKPCEKEIRQLLLKHNPSALGKVDSLLGKYKGREKELLAKIKDKYEAAREREVRHEDVYYGKEEDSEEEDEPQPSTATSSSSKLRSSLSAKMTDNPLRNQVQRNAERSSSLKQRQVDQHISMDSIYGSAREEDEFERLNPMVVDDDDSFDESRPEELLSSQESLFASSNPLMKTSSNTAKKRSSFGFSVSEISASSSAAPRASKGETNPMLLGRAGSNSNGSISGSNPMNRSVVYSSSSLPPGGRNPLLGTTRRSQFDSSSALKQSKQETTSDEQRRRLDRF